jgi:hypothetical protein
MTRNEIGMGKVMQPSLSLVGALKGPHLFDIVELHWKKKLFLELKKQFQLYNIKPACSGFIYKYKTTLPFIIPISF